MANNPNNRRVLEVDPNNLEFDKLIPVEYTNPQDTNLSPYGFDTLLAARKVIYYEEVIDPATGARKQEWDDTLAQNVDVKGAPTLARYYDAKKNHLADEMYFKNETPTFDRQGGRPQGQIIYHQKNGTTVGGARAIERQYSDVGVLTTHYAFDKRHGQVWGTVYETDDKGNSSSVYYEKNQPVGGVKRMWNSIKDKYAPDSMRSTQGKVDKAIRAETNKSDRANMGTMGDPYRQPSSSSKSSRGSRKLALYGLIGLGAFSLIGNFVNVVNRQTRKSVNIINNVGVGKDSLIITGTNGVERIIEGNLVQDPAGLHPGNTIAIHPNGSEGKMLTTLGDSKEADEPKGMLNRIFPVGAYWDLITSTNSPEEFKDPNFVNTFTITNRLNTVGKTTTIDGREAAAEVQQNGHTANFAISNADDLIRVSSEFTRLTEEMKAEGKASGLGDPFAVHALPRMQTNGISATQKVNVDTNTLKVDSAKLKK